MQEIYKKFIKYINLLWIKIITYFLPQNFSSPSVKKPDTSASSTSLQHITAAFAHNLNSHEYDKILNNLKTLKVFLEQPKEESPDLRFFQLHEHLGLPECHETVRQDRWHPSLHCPHCNSQHVTRLPSLTEHPHRYRYQCLDCTKEFEDDTGTPLAGGTPPLSVWMQCWYLMGFTSSFSYIATKLNLDLAMVEWMVLQLQKTFQAEQPLTHFVDYRDRLKNTSLLQQKMRKEDRLKNNELINSADVSSAPKDTAEYRKQQIRRSNPGNSNTKI